jgi:hypothetical protein
VIQNRGANDVPPLFHLNAQGIVDYDNTKTDGLNVIPTARGAMAINKAGNLLAIGSSKNVKFFDIAYDEGSGIPALTASATIANINLNVTNIDALAFDVAGNLYAATASTEWFFAYALPKQDNSFTTPAPSTAALLAITGSTSSVALAVDGKAIQSVSYTTPAGIAASEASPGLLLKKTTYTDGSVKVEKVIK